jgi:hypothetical protein
MQTTDERPSIFIIDNPIFSSQRMLYMEYYRKVSVEKSLVVILKGLNANTNWLAVTSQSYSNFDFDFDFEQRKYGNGSRGDPEPWMALLSLGPVDKLLLTIADTIILGFDYRRGHDHIFIFKNLSVLKWDLLFNERRALTINGHFPSTGCDSSRHTLTNWPSPLLPSHIHTSLLSEQSEDQHKFIRNHNQWASRFSQSRETEKLWSWIPRCPEPTNECAGTGQQQITAVFRIVVDSKHSV